MFPIVDITIIDVMITDFGSEVSITDFGSKYGKGYLDIDLLALPVCRSMEGVVDSIDTDLQMVQLCGNGHVMWICKRCCWAFQLVLLMHYIAKFNGGCDNCHRKLGELELVIVVEK